MMWVIVEHVSAWISLAFTLAVSIAVAGLVVARSVNRVTRISGLVYEAFKSSEETRAAIDEIAKQLVPNSGASLRDVVNRLEDLALASRITVESCEVLMESGKVLSESDRRLAEQLEKLVIQLTHKVDIAAVASTTAAKLAEGVALDLEAAHQRAEAHDTRSAVPGEAADAAMRRSEAADAAMRRSESGE